MVAARVGALPAERIPAHTLATQVLLNPSARHPTKPHPLGATIRDERISAFLGGAGAITEAGGARC
jgi:hypothetical protein